MMTLQEVLDQLTAHSKSLHEIGVMANELSIGVDGRLVVHGDALCLGPEARAALARFVRIPATGFDALDEEERSFLFNRRFPRLVPSSERLMIRAKDKTATAVVSADALRPSSAEVLNVVLEESPGDMASHRADWRVDRFKLNGHLELSLTSARLAIEPRVGDIVQAGVRIEHSETQRSATVLATALYRLVCSNGAIVEACRASRTVDFKGAERPDTRSAALAAIRSRAKEVWRNAKENLKALKSAAETPIENPRQALVSLGQELRLGTPLRDALLDAFAEDPGDTLYDIYNAMTRVATHSDALKNQSGLQHRLMAASGRLVDPHARRCTSCGRLFRGERL